MRSRGPPRAALLSALLSGFVVLIQSRSTTSMGANLSSTVEAAFPAEGHFGADGDNSTDAEDLLRSLGVDSVTSIYLETSDSDTKSNTDTPFLGSTGESSQSHIRPTVASEIYGHSNKEGLIATGTVPLKDVPAAGATPQTTNTSGAEWVTVTSLRVQYTAVQRLHHASLEANAPPLGDNNTHVPWNITPPEMPRMSENNETTSPEIAALSNSEILALAMGSLILTALVSSLSYQLVVSLRRKKKLKINCSVYVIQNEMYKNDMEASNLEQETRL